MTRYRIRRRARGWAIQMCELVHVQFPPGSKELWSSIATHRFHFIASFRLWFLRERERSRTGYRGRVL